MTFFNRKLFRSCFTILCAIAVTFMVGYWFYKYQVEDRDIGVVDYIPFEDSKDFQFPVVSLCFKDPFIGERLREIDSSITRSAYRKYLRGEVYDKAFEKIDYANVTIDLEQYFFYADILWRNETITTKVSDFINHKEVFNGYLISDFIKCFIIDYYGEDKKKIEAVRFYYDKKKLQSDWRWCSTCDKLLRNYNLVYYPGQFFLGNEFLASYMNKQKGLGVQIQHLEIIQRRNSRKRKCSEVIDEYDNMIVNEFMLGKECRPPYFMGAMYYPKCNNQKKIKEHKFGTKIRQKMRIPKSCQRISKVRTRIINTDEGKYSPSKEWSFRIFYPEEIKVITQSKDVDVHSLIGNIGGYLGLFLGKTFIQFIIIYKGGLI